MWTVPILFGIGCAVACMVAARSGNPDAKHLSLGLLAMWALANAAWYFNALVLLSALDWAFGTVAVVAWWGSNAKWIGWLIHLTLARLVLHVLDYATGHAFLVSYIHGLNLLFMLELVAVSYEGWRGGLFLFRGFRRLHLFLRSSQADKVKG